MISELIIDTELKMSLLTQMGKEFKHAQQHNQGSFLDMLFNTNQCQIAKINCQVLTHMVDKVLRFNFRKVNSIFR